MGAHTRTGTNLAITSRRVSHGGTRHDRADRCGIAANRRRQTMENETSRRGFLASSTAAAAAGALAVPAEAAPAPGVYARLGIRPVINGVGVVTHLGGSLMHPEVSRAMEEAARCFVPLTELQAKVGTRIAELLGAEAAMVTGGCASAITMGTVACVARGDREKLKSLPDTAGMKNEIVQQKS